MIVFHIGIALALLVLLALLYSVVRDRDVVDEQNRQLRSLLSTARMLVAEFREAELDERAPPKVPPSTLSIAGAWIVRVDAVRGREPEELQP